MADTTEHGRGTEKVFCETTISQPAQCTLGTLVHRSDSRNNLVYKETIPSLRMLETLNPAPTMPGIGADADRDTVLLSLTESGCWLLGFVPDAGGRGFAPWRGVRRRARDCQAAAGGSRYACALQLFRRAPSW